MSKVEKNRPKRAKTGGRQKGVPNKANRELRDIAGAYTEEAVETLADIMRKSESDQARATAADKLLDRAHGKAPQAMNVSHEGAITVRSAAVSAVALLIAEATGGGAS
jgi:hypothetical protein